MTTVCWYSLDATVGGDGVEWGLLGFVWLISMLHTVRWISVTPPVSCTASPFPRRSSPAAGCAARSLHVRTHARRFTLPSRPHCDSRTSASNLPLITPVEVGITVSILRARLSSARPPETTSQLELPVFRIHHLTFSLCIITSAISGSLDSFDAPER